MEGLNLDGGRCHSCGLALEAADRFCADCGAERRLPRVEISDAVTCAACGSANRPSSKFCITCGATMGPFSGTAQVWRMPEATRWKWRSWHILLIAVGGLLYLLYEIWAFSNL